MRFRTLARRSAPAAGLALALIQALPALGDEPSRLGRLFRFGAGSSSGASSSSASSGPGRSGPGTPAPAGAAGGSALGGPSSGGSAGSSAGRGASPTLGDRDPYQPIGDSYAPPALSTASPHSVVGAGSNLAPTPRIAPKPRVNKGITDADPLVTRIALGRADGGSQFAMVTQVYADGTVIDSTGVHKITPELLKPVVEAIGSGDFGRIKGHCGGPAGDTFENFQVVTFERAYGRLRANAFSYSGNPQGCDHSVFHLHKVLDDLQMKMATPPGGPTVAGTVPAVIDAPATGPAPTPLALDAPAPTPTGPSGALAMPGLPDPGLHD